VRVVPLLCIAVVAVAGAAALPLAASGRPGAVDVREYAVPAGSHPHDVAPARHGGVWYTGQAAGELGWLDPQTGDVRRLPLGAGSAPHGVIVGPDGAPWITDGGLNAIVRVDPRTRRVRRFPLPKEGMAANLNTATFDRRGVLWFTGQSGLYGRLDPKVGRVKVFADTRSGRATVLRPPTAGQGARRVWSDSRGRIWVSEWNAGKLAMFDPAKRRWREWRLPGPNPQPYAVYVDERDIVWLSDFGANALVSFDPRTERFSTIPLPSAQGEVRQLLGRRGEVWGAESGVDKLVVVRQQ
jgi:virginiamycin B lyase